LTVNKDYGMEVLLIPPIAFVIYLVLAAILSGFGRLLAGHTASSLGKTSTYTGGEQLPATHSLPGYRGFFVIALFFAILHLGVLMVGSSSFAPVAGIYLIALILALLVLIVG
jgi:NADH:ubiquinone oxidoreductase subunit 3 (subunit A)